VQEIDWALVLNLHQPSRNIEEMVADQEWQAKEVLWAMDRIPRSLWGYEDVGKVHLSLSGTLLEALGDPAFQERFYGVVDCGSLLWHLQNTRIVDVLGTGYYHPVFPLVPAADWDEHLLRWSALAGQLFNRSGFPGFWPPEMGFSMEMIPHLRRLGYRYVLVDSEHVRPVGDLRWEEVMYRPHLARHGGQEIVVVVRDRDLSNAQESGMELEWFCAEVAARTRHCDFRPLVTTCTDGENGGWFRNTGHNFWSAFYRPLLEEVRAGGAGGVRPSFIHDHLDRYGVHGEVTVGPGAWNTGWHDGSGFVQWTGSAAQRAVLARVGELSDDLQRALRGGSGTGPVGTAPGGVLEQARQRLLRAQTSCNFFWGEAWLERCEADLDGVAHLLDLAGAAVGRA
jgi:alpha-amylase/alpha-mannosidase (GH57 family)